VDVGSVSDISQVHTASIFRVKLSRVSEFSYVYELIGFGPADLRAGKGGGWCPVPSTNRTHNQVLIGSIGGLCVRKAEFVVRPNI
jgi:hypothetical protein